MVSAVVGSKLKDSVRFRSGSMVEAVPEECGKVSNWGRSVSASGSSTFGNSKTDS